MLGSLLLTISLRTDTREWQSRRTQKWNKKGMWTRAQKIATSCRVMLVSFCHGMAILLPSGIRDLKSKDVEPMDQQKYQGRGRMQKHHWTHSVVLKYNESPSTLFTWLASLETGFGDHVHCQEGEFLFQTKGNPSNLVRFFSTWMWWIMWRVAKGSKRREDGFFGERRWNFDTGQTTYSFLSQLSEGQKNQAHIGEIEKTR